MQYELQLESNIETMDNMPGKSINNRAWIFSTFIKAQYTCHIWESFPIVIACLGPPSP